jgi:hypothetical protein
MSLLCLWTNCIVKSWASWSESLFIKEIISNLFKYELSVKTLSTAEKEFGLILVGKLTMLPRLKESKTLSSWFF